jgi:hypothetical protein
MHDLDHPIFAGAKNTDSWCTRKGDLQRAFPLDVLMVPSSVLTITADSERMSCDGFSLGETIRFGNLEFITDYFSDLSFCPRKDGSDVVIMGSTHSGPPSLLRAMIRDSTEEFQMASGGEKGSILPSPRRHGARAPPALTTTIS